MPELDKPSGNDRGEQPQPRVIAYSTCLVEAVTGFVRRGSVQSVFQAATNILFPDDLLLSLNAFAAPRVPNSLQLTALAGTFPFTDLHVGQPVLLGANRLHIEALALSLDLTHCEQWNPKISRPEQLDLAVVAKNGQWLAEYVAQQSPKYTHPGHLFPSPGHPRGVSLPWTITPPSRPSMVGTPLAGVLGMGRGDDGDGMSAGQIGNADSLDVPEMAHLLCGRGPGLTPSGDDILAGWMAVNWLLHGPQPHLLTAYQHILAVAARQTHLLSQCWLRYAADGYVAEPIGVLLQALTREHEAELLDATRVVSALGATSGLDVIHGILLGLAAIAAW